MIRKTENMDLGSRNTFGMKVRCRLFVEITEESDLPELDFDSLPQPVFVMGGGSNLLFTGDFPGTVLHVAIDSFPAESAAGLSPKDVSTPGHVQGEGPAGDKGSQTPQETVGGAGVSKANGVPEGTVPAADGSLKLRLGAGVVFDDFCAWASAEDLWGPENLSLIPGEVGASAVQNIGAYGVEAKDIIETVHAWDRQERRFVDIPAADCGYGYRTSRFKTEWKGRFIITAVTFRLSRTPQPKLDYGGVRKALEARLAAFGTEISDDSLTPRAIRGTIIGIRRQKLPDPEEIGSAGSFFKNPVISKEEFERIVAIAREDNGPEYVVPHFEVGDEIKVPAAWMIDQCGFKGERLGGAQVYPQQPLVLVNATGRAVPEDVLALRDRIIRKIERKYGITLHCEVETV